MNAGAVSHCRSRGPGSGVAGSSLDSVSRSNSTTDTWGAAGVVFRSAPRRRVFRGSVTGGPAGAASVPRGRVFPAPQVDAGRLGAGGDAAAPEHTGRGFDVFALRRARGRQRD